MNKLDKPFKKGDKVEVNERGARTYSTLMRWRKGVIEAIPQERWHNNEVIVKWDGPSPSRERSVLACWALDLITE